MHGLKILDGQSLPLGIGNTAFVESGNEGGRFAVNARLRDPAAFIFIARTYSSSDVDSFLWVCVISAAAWEAGTENAAQGKQWRCRLSLSPHDLLLLTLVVFGGFLAPELLSFKGLMLEAWRGDFLSLFLILLSVFALSEWCWIKACDDIYSGKTPLGPHNQWAIGIHSPASLAAFVWLNGRLGSLDGMIFWWVFMMVGKLGKRKAQVLLSSAFCCCCLVCVF